MDGREPIGNLGCYRSRGLVTFNDMHVSCNILRDGERDSEISIYLRQRWHNPTILNDCTPLALALGRLQKNVIFVDYIMAVKGKMSPCKKMAQQHHKQYR